MKIVNGEKMVLGTCYYPEHWEKEIWREDLHRMKKCGIEVVRVAEFAWNLIEPEEGRFVFDFYDSFLDLAQEEEIKVIFSTPTATPPAWLTEKYPEVLNADRNGILYRHGGRRHYNYNSLVYQRFCARITEQSAAHYGKHPAVIGWQIDNEINCETDVFYSESDTVAFRNFLKTKYGSIDHLNDRWGTVFWNQTYNDFSQIYVPRHVINGNENPHQALDYIRFVSDSACRFVKMQSEIIEKYKKPEDFITTNGMFGHLDNHKMTQESLDFFCYDSYPDFAYSLDRYDSSPDALKDRWSSLSLSEIRAVSPRFGIMEQQSGAIGSTRGMEAPAPKPGQMTLWTMQSVAHGAEFISYFRWRTCTFGTEIYWHGILDYSGRENRRVREVDEIHEKLAKLSDVAGSFFEAHTGILKDYDNIWDIQVDAWHRRVAARSEDAIFEAAQRTHTPIDFLYLRENIKVEDLEKYDILFYPHPVIVTESRKKILEKYVRNGGKLILGCRSGLKDSEGHCVRTYLPGLLRKLAGTNIPEYTFVSPEDENVVIRWDGVPLKGEIYNDLLEPETASAEVLGCYENCYYEGTPGLIRNRFGKGEVYYFGATFIRETAEIFLQRLGAAEPWHELISLPESCEIAVRKKNDVRYFFVLNYAKESCEIFVKKEMTEVFSSQKVSGKVKMSRYGTAVFKWDAKSICI